MICPCPEKPCSRNEKAVAVASLVDHLRVTVGASRAAANVGFLRPNSAEARPPYPPHRFLQCPGLWRKGEKAPPPSVRFHPHRPRGTAGNSARCPPSSGCSSSKSIASSDDRSALLQLSECHARTTWPTPRRSHVCLRTISAPIACDASASKSLPVPRARTCGRSPCHRGRRRRAGYRCRSVQAVARQNDIRCRTTWACGRGNQVSRPLDLRTVGVERIAVGAAYGMRGS